MRVDRLSPIITTLSTTNRPAAAPKVLSQQEVADLLSPDLQFVSTMNSNLVRVASPKRELLAQVLSQQADIVDERELQEQLVFLRRQLKSQGLTAKDREAFRKLSARYSDGLAAYDAVLFHGIFHESDEKAVLDFVAEHEKQLRATVNTHKEVMRHVKLGADGLQLKRLYEEAVVQTASVLQSLRQLGSKAQTGNMIAMREFLVNACAMDLGALDVGADQVHLYWVLRELKGMRIFNMLLAETNKLQETRLKDPQENLFAVTLDCVDEPYRFMPVVKEWVSGASVAEQVLFFQDFRKIYTTIPHEAFVNEEQKADVRRVLQDHIDELVYSE